MFLSGDAKYPVSSDSCNCNRATRVDFFFESHEYFTCVKIGFYCEQWLRRNNGELLERGNFHKRNVIQILRGDLKHQSKKT